MFSRFVPSLALLLSFLLAAPAVSLQTPEEPADLAAEVEARELAFADTMATRDFEGFARFIAPDAIFFQGDRPLRGREAVTAAWRAYFDGEQAPFSWRPDLVEVLESGDLALSSGPVFDPTGRRIGRFNSVWRRDADGNWRVVFDKGSDPPCP